MCILIMTIDFDVYAPIREATSGNASDDGRSSTSHTPEKITALRIVTKQRSGARDDGHQRPGIGGDRRQRSAGFLRALVRQNQLCVHDLPLVVNQIPNLARCASMIRRKSATVSRSSGRG